MIYSWARPAVETITFLRPILKSKHTGVLIYIIREDDVLPTMFSFLFSNEMCYDESENPNRYKYIIRYTVVIWYCTYYHLIRCECSAPFMTCSIILWATNYDFHSSRIVSYKILYHDGESAYLLHRNLRAAVPGKGKAYTETAHVCIRIQYNNIY